MSDFFIDFQSCVSIIPDVLLSSQKERHQCLPLTRMVGLLKVVVVAAEQEQIPLAPVAWAVEVFVLLVVRTSFQAVEVAANLFPVTPFSKVQDRR